MIELSHQVAASEGHTRAPQVGLATYFILIVNIKWERVCIVQTTLIVATADGTADGSEVHRLLSRDITHLQLYRCEKRAISACCCEHVQSSSWYVRICLCVAIVLEAWEGNDSHQYTATSDALMFRMDARFMFSMFGVCVRAVIVVCRNITVACHEHP